MRRLAAHITQVKAKADDQPRRIKLMPVSVGLTADGQLLLYSEYTNL